VEGARECPVTLECIAYGYSKRALHGAMNTATDGSRPVVKIWMTPGSCSLAKTWIPPTGPILLSGLGRPTAGRPLPGMRAPVSPPGDAANVVAHLVSPEIPVTDGAYSERRAPTPPTNLVDSRVAVRRL
jgi:hypothetical protein